ncbi:MAG: TonB-dependent receptor, partial [Gemmatimonadota bacterium]
FSTPTSLNQFLDLATSVPNQANDPLARGAAQLGYSVRVQGTGTEGFTFRQSGGGYVMLSPFTPEGLGGPGQHIPASAALFYPAAVQVVAAQAAAQGNPLDPNFVGYLLSLQPTSEQIGTVVNYEGNLSSLSAFELGDVNPIRESISTGLEVGYQGLVRNRLAVAADLWWSRRDQLVTPLTVVNPLVLLNGQQLVQYLVPRFMQDLGMGQEQAVATATALAGSATSPGLATIPVGVISSPSVNANGAQFLATYTNVDETLDVWGMDLGADFQLTDVWTLGATASWVSDDHFDVQELNGVVTLNAPTRKGSLSLGYGAEDRPFNGEVRVRYNNEFPVQSGVYEGTACIQGGNAPTQECVESYTLLDLQLGYRLPGLDGAALQLNVQNLLDEEYRSYPGTPAVGTLALLRLTYSF